MREIKFKAWDKKEKTWILDFHLTPYGKFLIWEDENNAYNKPKYDIELLQFIGLLDKNGKEIYEGDIVKCNVGIGTVKFGNYDVDNITDSEHTGFYLDISNLTMDIPLTKDRHLRIIGNIYENEDLLK